MEPVTAPAARLVDLVCSIDEDYQDANTRPDVLKKTMLLARVEDPNGGVDSLFLRFTMDAADQVVVIRSPLPDRNLEPIQMLVLLNQINEDANAIVGVGVDRPTDISGDRFRKGFAIDGPMLLYVGRVVESKGCDQLFRDFIRWKDDGNAHRGTLVVLGRSEMPIPARSDIKHLGYASDSDKWDAYDAADLLVMPSRLESLSIVSLEAWSAGKPLLCHAGSAVLRSMSRRSGGGLFYRDYDEFGALLDLLLADAGLRATLGAGGRAFVERTYTWPVVVEKYRDLIA